MTSFAEFNARHIRRAILQLLAGTASYQANDQVLHSACVSMGFPDRRSMTAAEIDWLADHGLVRVEAITSTLRHVTATERGVEVGQGHALFDGVERAAPRR